MMGRLDPEWSKLRRNRMIKKWIYDFFIFLSVILLIFLFVAYKGFERNYKLKKQNNDSSIRFSNVCVDFNHIILF